MRRLDGPRPRSLPHTLPRTLRQKKLANHLRDLFNKEKKEKAEKQAADHLAAEAKRAADVEAKRQAKEEAIAAERAQRKADAEAKHQAMEAAAAQKMAEHEALKAAQKLADEQAAAAAHEANYRLNAFGTDVPPREWNQHDSDWIYQGGPETDATKHDVYYNQWGTLDASPVDWHITEEVDPSTADPWLTKVGRDIY